MSQMIGLRLCLVALILLSGCNALSDGETAETPSVTPAPVPTDAPMSSRGLAPGLTRLGVVDPIALSKAHVSVLNQTSFTVRVKKTMKYTNGTLRARMTTISQVMAPTEQYYVTYKAYVPNIERINHTTRNKAMWSNGERVLVAVTQANTTTYQHYESPDHQILRPDPPRGKWFINLFYAIDTRVTNHTTRNGTTLYQITATTLTQPASLTAGRIHSYKNPRNLTFHAVIDSRGLVHEYRLAYTVTSTETRHPRTIRIVRTVRYTNIGTTTVDRPSWYTTANRTTPTTRDRSHQ